MGSTPVAACSVLGDGRRATLVVVVPRERPPGGVGRQRSPAGTSALPPLGSPTVEAASEERTRPTGSLEAPHGRLGCSLRHSGVP